MTRREPGELRDREMARKTIAPLGSPFEAKVVGVSFRPAYPGVLFRLDEVWKENAQRDEPLPAILVRDPDNEIDRNAVQVHVPALGDDAWIGFLTRPIVNRLAPEMDNGIRWAAEVVNVLIDSDWLDRPGISIKCYRLQGENNE